MEKDWEKFYIAKNNFEAEIVHGLLEDNGIPALILNKRDSSIPAFGEIEIYTHKDHVEKAKRLLKENPLE